MTNFDQKDPKGRHATVASASPYESHRRECVTVLSEVAVSRIRTAHEGIRAIATVLQQREVDFDSDKGEGLSLSGVTVNGLIAALVCCADFAEDYATGDGVAGTTQRFDCDTTEDHWRIFHAAGAEASKRKG